MKNLIQINEVDCYIGNALKTKYATDRAVQHQILVNRTPLGRRNGIADSDRGERIVIEKEVSNGFVTLFNRATELANTLKSEICYTMEEYEAAKEYNTPIKDKINVLLIEMHKIESLDLDFKTFKAIINYV